ncbi:MAG: hypothetical protein COA86_15090 [Kangiella sp.]|nr:MAG: hypothetical protein COA86_15090 [Kangiella sp.]
MGALNFIIGYFAIAIVLKIFLWQTILLGIHNSKIRIVKSLILAISFGPSFIISAHAIIPATSLLGLIVGVGFENGQLTSSIQTLLVFVGAVLFTSVLLYGYYTQKWKASPEIIAKRTEDLSGVTELVKKAHK